jgi:hypothetical protein
VGSHDICAGNSILNLTEGVLAQNDRNLRHGAFERECPTTDLEDVGQYAFAI